MTAAPPPTPAAPDVGPIFSRAWQLLRANPIVFMPILAFGVTIVAVVSVLALLVIALLLRSHGAMTPAHDAGGFFAAVFGAYALFWCVGLIAQFALFAAVYGLANAAWTRGSATGADAWNAVRSRAVAIFVATIGLAGLGIAAMIVALPTLFLSLLALPLFTMFVYPAVIAGRDGFGAVAESLRLVRRNFGVSAVATVVLVAIQYASSFIAFPFILPLQITWITSQPVGRHAALVMPPTFTIVLAGVGYLLVGAFAIVILGFAAIVQTGLYHALRARAEAVPAVAP